MKKVASLLALVSVATIATAVEPVVIKDTRSGTSIDGAPGSGVLLTRQGDACSLTEYKRSTDKSNEVALPVVDHRIFRCDAQGNRLSTSQD
ncbi:hypothetical protein [Burkholderia gladioli]|uniref:hypothetical protein n=1 Tax=Burkholderia gladioli TaxID=28095 RepID=UPI0016413B16|nr:hypothetical protein [Burkholderia gladioli]MDN7466238.1 hypothetical protein [Burkholderia gladioli]